MIVILRLPNRSTPPQERIDPIGGVRLPAMQYCRQFVSGMWLDDGIDVIVHHAPCEQVGSLVREMEQLILHQICNFPIAHQTLADPLIQPSFHPLGMQPIQFGVVDGAVRLPPNPLVFQSQL
ncbi:MAG TPA: hypothetical protein PKB10_01720, partial [Tepidisphaeraceae bacterium]|nr:hypothetical protein [Tepidisphaeraceae bacterium]